MQEHLTSDSLGEYLSRRYTPDQIQSLHAHCRACPECRDLLARAAAESATLRPTHLTEQETVDFATGFPKPGWAREHLENCAVCASAVQDLMDFGKREQASNARNIPVWAKTAAAAALLAVALGAGFAVMHRPKPEVPKPAVLLVDSIGPVTRDSQLPEAELVRAALRDGRLPFPPPGPATQQDALRGSPSPRSGIAIIGPAGVRVASDRPVFRWSACAGGTYQAQIFDPDLNLVQKSPKLSSTEWRPDTALPRDRRFLWQVTANCGGRTVTGPQPPDEPARFDVAPEAVALRIAAAGPSHLALAVIYAQEGLEAEARAEVDALEALNPGSGLVAALRRSLPTEK